MGVQSGPRGRAFAPPPSPLQVAAGPGHANLPVLPPLSRTVRPPAVAERVGEGLMGLVLAETAPHALDAATADRGNALTELAQRGDHTLANPSRLNANRSRGPPPLPP